MTQQRGLAAQKRPHQHYIPVLRRQPALQTKGRRVIHSSWCKFLIESTASGFCFSSHLNIAWDIGWRILPAPAVKVVDAGPIWYKSVCCQEIDEIGHHHLGMCNCRMSCFRDMLTATPMAIPSVAQMWKIVLRNRDPAPTLALCSMPLTSKPLTTQYGVPVVQLSEALARHKEIVPHRQQCAQLGFLALCLDRAIHALLHLNKGVLLSYLVRNFDSRKGRGETCLSAELCPLVVHKKSPVPCSSLHDIRQKVMRNSTVVLWQM